MSSPKCSVIIPTRNRRATLASTLNRLTRLPDSGLEIIVVDNGSTDGTPGLAAAFASVRWIWLGTNLGCAARNVGAAAASAPLLLMLDDDSWPAAGVVDRAVERFRRDAGMGAVACRVRLATAPHRHDAGGVPGVFFNCGAFLRRDALEAAGGFPADFDYYVEEYDLACRLWQRGWRIEPHGDLLVWHDRVGANRDNNRMLRFLVRNNLRLWDRYAPASVRRRMLDETLERYARVANKENAVGGYQEGLREGREAMQRSRRRNGALSVAEFTNLFGLDRARVVLAEWADKCAIRKTAIWQRGKGCEQLMDLLGDLNISIEAVCDDAVHAAEWRGAPLLHLSQFAPGDCDGVVVGSLSPGTAQDTRDDLRRAFPELPSVSAAPWIHDGEAASRCGTRIRRLAASGR